jgi:hypothetical protein
MNTPPVDRKRPNENWARKFWLAVEEKYRVPCPCQDESLIVEGDYKYSVKKPMPFARGIASGIQKVLANRGKRTPPS